jgi:hypothetical protein
MSVVIGMEFVSFFPGNSAALFYQLSKEKKIDWNLFDNC